tara:strand:+ start:9435 stop:9542 length:108 start_codon:yes stop_codon:yes gene_type:complete
MEIIGIVIIVICGSIIDSNNRCKNEMEEIIRGIEK